MAHLWLLENHCWTPASLSTPVWTLSTDGALRPLAPGEEAALQLRSLNDTQWALLAARRLGVRVNGEALVLGIRVLRDRDEIVVGAMRSYFSSERLAAVEPFPISPASVHCARCHKEVAPGTLAVRCPNCGNWCHQNEDRGCWLYLPKCPTCEQQTPLATGFRWQPNF